MTPDLLLTLGVIALAFYGFYSLIGAVLDAFDRHRVRRGGYLDLTSPVGRERLGLKREERR